MDDPAYSRRLRTSSFAAATTFTSTRPRNQPYRALLLPSGRVQEVFVSLWHYGSGAPPTRIFSERPLRARPYVAETPIPVTFDAADVASAGLCRARLNVQIAEKETQAVDFYFIGAR